MTVIGSIMAIIVCKRALSPSNSQVYGFASAFSDTRIDALEFDNLSDATENIKPIWAP
jgi:hypothetical protein